MRSTSRSNTLFGGKPAPCTRNDLSCALPAFGRLTVSLGDSGADGLLDGWLLGVDLGGDGDVEVGAEVDAGVVGIELVVGEPVCVLGDGLVGEGQVTLLCEVDSGVTGTEEGVLGNGALVAAELVG